MTETAKTTPSFRLSQEGARTVHLAAQGLVQPRTHPVTRRDVLGVIRQMGALQIDSISIVARSPYLARRVVRGTVRHQGTALLSPFDPVVWDRARLLDLWNFHYRIEVYTPVDQRRYGYYTLPILHRGRMVGRLDPKAHRATGVLEIRQIHLEAGVEATPDLVDGLANALSSFATWQNLTAIEILRSNPPEFASLLQKHLA